MSEDRLSRLMHRLGLLARKDVQLSSDGRVLSGAIDPELELLYRQVDEIHDQVLDGHPLNHYQRQFLAYCQELIDGAREQVRQLELQYA